jgi:hypothetical protein
LIIPYGGTREKFGRGFCSSDHYEQKPLSFFEIMSSFAEICFKRRGVKQTKTGGFEKLGEGGFGEVSSMLDPRGGKWYWEWGSDFTRR